MSENGKSCLTNAKLQTRGLWIESSLDSILKLGKFHVKKIRLSDLDFLLLSKIYQVPISMHTHSWSSPYLPLWMDLTVLQTSLPHYHGCATVLFYSGTDMIPCLRFEWFLKVIGSLNQGSSGKGCFDATSSQLSVT